MLISYNNLLFQLGDDTSIPVYPNPLWKGF